MKSMTGTRMTIITMIKVITIASMSPVLDSSSSTSSTTGSGSGALGSGSLSSTTGGSILTHAGSWARKPSDVICSSLKEP